MAINSVCNVDDSCFSPRDDQRPQTLAEYGHRQRVANSWPWLQEKGGLVRSFESKAWVWVWVRLRGCVHMDIDKKTVVLLKWGGVR